MTDDRTMTGKVCLITGATAGIGAMTARRLAERGASLILVGRDTGRGQALAAELGDLARAPAEFMQADLSSLKGVQRLAEAVQARHDALHVLVNNAGAMFGRRQENAEGIEMTFALNHLCPFLLTRLLFDRLRAGAPARIVTVASEAHRTARLDLDDLQGLRRYRGWTAYQRSKLANILFTYELDRRFAGSGVTANALHPGFVSTGIGTRHGLLPGWMWRIATLWAISQEKGAETSVYLAASPEVEGVTGKYFIACRQAASNAASYDQAAAERLWRISETTVAALTGPLP